VTAFSQPGPVPVPGADIRALLQSVVDVARAIFGAAASSVFLLDESAGELVFQAVSGEGEDFLVGSRMPTGRGIAGWVAASGQALEVGNLAADRAFARDLAESTRYVPDALMAAPLLWQDQVLGVIEVLDPATQSRSDLASLDLLSLFAHQTALALRVAGETGNHPVGGRPADPDGEQLVDAFREFMQQRSR
jgi:GAF domain-containing protein